MPRRLPKPAEIFARDEEWRALVRFAVEPSSKGSLGLVYGRRRQGKSWLVERLAERASGWYWEAIEGSKHQQLEAFATALATRAKLPAVPAFVGWAEALEATWRAAPPVLVLDEFQHLVSNAPELPSILQSLVSRRRGPRTILCGSALGPMRALLATDAPLRGRASLELVVRPFDYRAAASHWRLGRRWQDAARLHALVGGTPAYFDFAGRRSPTKTRGFDDWVCDVLLDPAGALFREGRILTDEPTLTDRGLYHGILAAIARGCSRRGQIAASLGRADNTLAHPLDTLVELALVERVDDPLHVRRSFFRLAEPLLRTHRVLIAPNEGTIERRGARATWRAIGATVPASIYGPHFEHLAREWTHRYASAATLGGTPQSVGPTVVADAAARKELEIDVVATSGKRALAIGEAKWAGPLGMPVLAELEHRRTLLGTRAEGVKLLLFCGGGFDRKLRAAAKTRRDLELVDLERLYGGD